MRKYFGTDGIRGPVGTPPITADFVLKLGWAAGKTFSPSGGGNILIGKDTRISGYLFESALEAGLASAGVHVTMLGPMPTPAVAYLTRAVSADAGIVISASHNPFSDNGIKFFSSEGRKLPDEVELEIERLIDEPMTTVASADLGKADRMNDAVGRYVEFCKTTFPKSLNLKQMKLVVDCAHGATYKIAPAVFQELGAQVIAIGCSPDGLNINEGFGATSPEALAERVVQEGADLGIALDGDGDRLVMVDHLGEVVDGDELLLIIALHQQAKGLLTGGVVGTLMSNLGLEVALKDRGIAFARAQVGDRYVVAKLLQEGWHLGGEGSGHILCLDQATTGDGVVSALQVLRAITDQGKTLADLKGAMTKFPQVMINVPANSAKVMENNAVQSAVRDVDAVLGDKGRVLLRPSGTEPLIRVMVEGEDAPQVRRLAAQLAAVVAASED
ncbi:phosphoglucosamine mutase [Pseudomonadales bacterium]|jgi:phosphoglucosamine mutase|nr:phosphoglucosamine mutase [Pseudomonadales bacterium]MDA8950802.1 phosphoglucosamine mutase [Pseudomonadales bacterium]MDA9282047.1 phosphoglucosamine mutase [Pseudomonadales bacterium]MDB2328334.1 phosphoglucosamine mutase [Pseudomonadales bacterium]